MGIAGVRTACAALLLVVTGAADAAVAQVRPTEGEPSQVPEDAIARAIRVGDARAEGGRHALALFAYDRALELDPDNAQAHDGAGRQLIALGLRREAVDHFLRAAWAEPEEPERWALLGDACRIAHALPCAASAYLTALRLAPNARAAAGIDALGGGAVARAHAASAQELEAEAVKLPDDHPVKVGGPAFALGVVPAYAGAGLQLAWTWVAPGSPLALAPYASVGIVSPDDFVLGVAAGFYAMVGDVDRWVLQAGYGAIGRTQLHVYEEQVAERSVYAVTFGFGRQWNYAGGVFLRALLGASFPVDAYHDFVDAADLQPAFAVGYQP